MAPYHVFNQNLMSIVFHEIEEKKEKKKKKNSTLDPIYSYE